MTDSNSAMQPLPLLIETNFPGQSIRQKKSFGKSFTQLSNLGLNLQVDLSETQMKISEETNASLSARPSLDKSHNSYLDKRE